MFSGEHSVILLILYTGYILDVILVFNPESAIINIQCYKVNNFEFYVSIMCLMTNLGY